MTKSKGRTSKMVIVMISLTLITKFLGFIREILIGKYFGVTNVTDAYIVATTIPMLLFVSVVAAIGTTFIPQYTKIKEDIGEKEALKYSNNILNIVCIFSLVFLCLGYIFTDEIVGVIANGFNDDTLTMAIQLTKISLPMIFGLGIIQVLIALLQSEKRFIITAFINIPITVTVIIALMLSDVIGIQGVVIANSIGVVLQVVILTFSARKIGFKYNCFIKFNDKFVKSTFKLMIPVVIGSSVQQLNVVVDRTLASGLAEGSISALNFAAKINEVIFGLISVTIGTFIFPTLAQLSSKKNTEEFSRVVTSSLNTITLIIMPLSTTVLLMNNQIVKVLFERGAFNETATIMTANALFFYSIGMIFFGYRDILNKTFYSVEDTKTPMFNGILAIICNIVLNLILREVMGYKGLALASSMAAIITTILLYMNLTKKIGQINISNFIGTFIKALIISVVSGYITLGSYTLFINIINNVTIALIISCIIGILTYVMMLVPLKINEVDYILEQVKINR